MSPWETKRVPLVYALGEWRLLGLTVRMRVASVALGDGTTPDFVDGLRPGMLDADCRGYLIRMLPVDASLPMLERRGPWLRYCFQQYRRCYIDLGMTSEEYARKFSSKTRSTLKRKLKKYSGHCGGRVRFEVYRKREEMRVFFSHARVVSRLTYQERLLHLGIPSTDAFIERAEQAAADGGVLACVLFDKERPVSYLYCPVADGVVGYSYLGYDPDYADLSVGAVLHWLVIQHLFLTREFRYLDFGEGESEHKLLFSTKQQQCANVFLFRNTVRNKIGVVPHMLLMRLSHSMGSLLGRWGLKRALKKLLRKVA